MTTNQDGDTRGETATPCPKHTAGRGPCDCHGTEHGVPKPRYNLLQFAGGKYGLVLGKEMRHVSGNRDLPVEQRLILRDENGPCLNLETVALWDENTAWHGETAIDLKVACVDIDHLIDAGRDMRALSTLVKKHT